MRLWLQALHRLKSRFSAIDKKIEKTINERIQYYITLINVNNSFFAETLYASTAEMKNADFKRGTVDFKVDSVYKFAHWAAIAVGFCMPIANLFIPSVGKKMI